MGQYYQATILKKDYKSNKQPVEAWMSSFDYGNNGMKLMEHSYRGNRYVKAFESLIDDKKGKYAGYPVVWAGDYADVEKGYEKEKLNIYGLADNTKPLVIKDKMLAHRYIINLDKIAYKEVNFKSKLLEWCQKNRVKIEFKLLSETTDSYGSPMFCFQVLLEGVEGSTGTGFSKKESQQNAARQTLTLLRRNPQFIDSVFQAKSNRIIIDEESVENPE